MDTAEIEREVLATSASGNGPQLGGPVRIIDTTEGADGSSTYQVSASQLVPIEEDDPDLTGVSIAVPVTATIEIDGDGAIVGIDVPIDPAAQREARSFTRNLIARGAVSGLATSGPARRGPGLATRPTHELTVDEFGRRVIRRTGFSATSAPPGPATPEDARTPDGESP
jgi:hypothetical protein